MTPSPAVTPGFGGAPSRRTALAAAGGLVLLSACSGDGGEDEVTATEDLMREHGVLRRLLVVYRESAALLRSAPRSLDAGALAAASDLFRVFGEDYHERQLEEQRIFPRVRKLGGEAGRLTDVLKGQHDRGRQINRFVKQACASGAVATGSAEPLARALDGFTRMYEAHAAWEDTIVFPAWKKSLSKHELEEAGEEFEDIEKRQFRGDGFDMAVDRVAGIERRLGLHDLARFTAPAPEPPDSHSSK
jgi:hemerythrin-like domain-containing protein